MTDMQRYKRTDDGVMLPDGDGRWVLASDAEAAINAAENLAYERGVKAGYAAVKQAEQDMLAKCIAAVEESVPWSAENWMAVNERAAILAALRSLQKNRSHE